MTAYPAINVIQEVGGPRLALEMRPLPFPAPGQVRVRVSAAALNYRDYALMHGLSFSMAEPRYIPLSDASGVIDAVGRDDASWKIGDRVCSLFFPDWQAGRPLAATRRALGSSDNSVGQRYFIANENAVIAAPAHLSDIEAATLPCAGLTAWNAVMESGAIRPGDTILLQGTGGVSLFALQFAVTAGYDVIITSSSDEKLEQAKALGARHGINYKRTPEWSKAAVQLTGGVGVDLIVEVGGAQTFMQSLEAIRLGGAISVVGMLSGGSDMIDIRNIYGKNALIRGVTVGSREAFAAMNRAISTHGIKPIVAQVFPWTDAAKAFDALARGGQFGKIVLDFEADAAA